MKLVCLDLEGVLVPEIWIAFSESSGIKELRRTTRDEPNYDKLMNYRIDILKKNNVKLADIQNAIARIEPLDGAVEFTKKLRVKTQLVILSDTFEQFARPLMEKLYLPTLFCNSLITSQDGYVTGYNLRQKNGKQKAIAAFKSLNIKVFASGDSYNDIAMIKKADRGCLFKAPESIRLEFKNLKNVDSYDDLMKEVEKFIADDL